MNLLADGNKIIAMAMPARSRISTVTPVDFFGSEQSKHLAAPLPDLSAPLQDGSFSSLQTDLKVQSTTINSCRLKG